MRPRPALIPLAILLLPALAARPAPAQAPADTRALDRRVTALEGQMRAVQRQVFPGGDKRFFAPEIVPEPRPEPPAPGATAPSPLVELTQRVTTLETQQRELTGQVEQIQFQLRQMEAAMERLRRDTEGRLQALEPKPAETIPAPGTGAGPQGAASPAPPVPQAQGPAPGGAPGATPTGADAIEARYLAAYRLYEARDYAAAHKALSAFVAAHPKHPRASNAQFWAGRALMAQGQTADAAKAFLAGYKQFPRGERAHNSLLWLGKALIDLKQPQAACQALDELRTTYADRLTGALAADAAQTRARAGCRA